jgi:hypothetical protein
MLILQILIALALVFGGYKYWQHSTQEQAPAAAASQSVASANGFVSLPQVEGQTPGAVLVFAAQDCPLEDAQRADSLASELSRSGVPVRRINDISFSGDPAEAGRLSAVMNGALPIVFVNGRGKANPTLSEVLAEYRGK